MVDTLDKNLDFLTMPGKAAMQVAGGDMQSLVDAVRIFVPVQASRNGDALLQTMFREVEALDTMTLISKGVRSEVAQATSTTKTATQTPSMPPAAPSNGWSRS